MVIWCLLSIESNQFGSRKIWVDPKLKVVLRQELYAKSGMLIKDVEFFGYRPVGKRLFPKKMVFRDLSKKNSQTTYIFDAIKFDIEIPAKYFAQSILKK